MRKLIAYLFERRFGAFIVRGRTYWRDYGHELENGRGVSRVGRFFKGLPLFRSLRCPRIEWYQ